MSWGPIQPTEIDFSDPGAPVSTALGDVHRTHAGALGQARHVFLNGNGLPGRWQRREQFVVLETGFGLGLNFLATWAAWRADAQRSTRLVYMALEKHPPRLADLARALAIQQEAEIRPLADALLAQWPPLTPDIHRLDLSAAPGEPGVQLLLAWGDMANVLPELVARVDAVYLDGFAPSSNPAMWQPRLLHGLNRLAAPRCTVATCSDAPALRGALVQAGFDVQGRPGYSGQQGMTAGCFRPRHVPQPPHGRRGQPQARRVAVVGAGLAGAAAARALARQGLQVQVLEALPGPAQANSGQAGGLFHSTVHWPDGPHARWLRAAALRAQQVIGPLVRAGQVAGQAQGLLRGESRRDFATMQTLLARNGLPPEHVQALVDAWPGGGAAWLYPGGGWAAPADLAAAWLHSPSISLHSNHRVARMAQVDTSGRQPLWQLRDADGRLLAEADAVVLANAQDAQRLLPQALNWPLVNQRGQTTLLPAGLAQHPALALPLPLAAGSYALRLPDGRVLCGASQHDGDGEAQLRVQDQAENLAGLRVLTGWPGHSACAADNTPAPAQGQASTDPWALPLAGRVGWRLATDDKLPLLGPVPQAQPQGQRLEQPRHVPRMPGLWVLTALGSRGITQAALAGEVLAAWLTESPVPLPASLIDALDPARYVSRALRRQAAEASVKRS